MLEPSKTKEIPKRKEKLNEICIEHGIPDPPQLIDFEINHSKSFIKGGDDRLQTTVNRSQNLHFTVKENEKEEKEFLCSQFKPVLELSISSSLHNKNMLCDSKVVENTTLRATDIENDGYHILEGNQAISEKQSSVNNNDCTNVCEYSTLTKAISTFEELHEASAPREENLFKFSQYLNLPDILKGNFDLNNYTFTAVTKELLIPFTDKKLSQFYENPELSQFKNNQRQFITEERTWNKEQNDNYFYNLLVEYIQSRICINKNKEKINELMKRMNNCTSNLWTVQNDAKIKEKGMCHDGNSIIFVQNHTQAHFNTNIYEEFVQLLNKIKYITFDAFVQDYFISSFLRLKIEYYLQCLLTSCPEFTKLETGGSVVTVKPGSYFDQCILNLKRAISVLFFFQKKQIVDADTEFLEESRVWLADLVSLLLRVGNWNHQIFLLNHIMRCPGGVGEWAASFIQLPPPTVLTDPFKSNEINHVMTVLHVFLGSFDGNSDIVGHETDGTNDSNPWTIVDSDGEIEGETNQSYCLLKERDLVLILNQIPFGNFFKTIFYYHDDEISSQFITSEYLMKLFAFGTDFIRILLSGMKFYSTRRYKQFTKRLGQLICHMVHYTTEAFTIFKSQNMESNNMLRIQTEYDNFFLKSTKFIFSAKKYGPWQFLATMPYYMPCSTTILKLYGILQLDENADENIINVNFSIFEEKFSQLPEEEQCYLLTTFANMALARDITEIDFIRNVVLQLLFIGFVSTSTMDHSNKTVEHLLCSICSHNPFLISDILNIQNHIFMTQPTFDEGLYIHLWLNLPLHAWRPTQMNLETLSQWLMEPVQSVRNELARIILQNLNYGIFEGELFLTPEVQRGIAFTVMRASVKFSNEVEQGFIKNMSNLVYQQNMEQLFSNWTWDILLKLRLHLLDGTEASLYSCLNNPEEHLINVPEVESNIELYHLVLKKYPTACFIALMTTTLGHSVPIMCDKGFALVESLFLDGKYNAGIACLEFMTYLFLDCCDSLYNCEKFVSILIQLLAPENSYVQMAKNLILNSMSGSILRNVECMIQNQLNCCKRLGFSKFSGSIKLWLISLTKLPHWIQESRVLYLMDKLFKNAFFDFASSKLVNDIVESLIEETKWSSEPKSSFSSLVGWMIFKFSIPSLLPNGFNGDVPWLSYVIIQAEFENYERKNLLWTELLKELHCSADKKTDIDNSLKKVCNQLGLPIRQSHCLAIYKWTHQILSTSIHHPLIPLMWQKFFYLYFFRVPGHVDLGSVGNKFFDGVLNQRLFQQLLHRLEDTYDHFKKLSKEDIKESHFHKCQQLFKTYTLWMDDTNLLVPHLNVHSFPPEYNPELLGLLIHGSDTPWIDFVEYQFIEQSLMKLGLNWGVLKSRFRKTRKLSQSIAVISARLQGNKLKNWFNNYEEPLPFPSYANTKKYVLHKSNISELINIDKTKKFFQPLIEKLLKFKEDYRSSMNHNIHLGHCLKELSPHLYVKSDTQKIIKEHCNGTSKIIGGKTVHYECSGPAIVNFKYEEFKLNEDAQKKFSGFEKAFDENVGSTISHLPTYVSTSAVTIDVVLEDIKNEYELAKIRSANDQFFDDLKETGVNLFYTFIKIRNKEVAGIPPLEHAFNRYIELLGKTFIQNNAQENGRLLELIINDEFYGEKLIRFLSPNASSNPQDFIKYYSTAMECRHSESLAVLLKFNMVQFLKDHNPKFSIRSALITSVKHGIVSYNEKHNENQSILKVLNEHLGLLLKYDFPEHYGEIFHFLLEASAKHAIGPDVWYTFLLSLSIDENVLVVNGQMIQNCWENEHSMVKLKHYFIKYASDQTLPLEVIKGTMTVLATHFRKERFKAGMFGLYQKYRNYIEPLFIFYGMLSYSLIAKTLEQDSGSLSEKINQQLWPLLNDLYTPWLIPYRNENLLNDNGRKDGCCDQDISLPWSMNDMIQAQFCVSIFTESIKFLLNTLPGFNNILNYLWFFYCNHFALPYVKDYVLNIIHDKLALLPWDMFSPGLQEVELMLHVVNQFLPLSHTFTGRVFFNLKWNEIVEYYMSSNGSEFAIKFHICLLHLLVKLSLEPSRKQNGKVIYLLNEANKFAWHLIDSNSYEVALNWFAMNCDPRIILMDERLEYFKLDSAIFRLLQTSAGFTTTCSEFHPTTLRKRAMFIRACVKWLILANKRFHCKDSPLFKVALYTMWDLMDSVITATISGTKRMDEIVVLLEEFLVIYGDPDLPSLIQTTLCDWLMDRKSEILVYGLIRSTGVSIHNPYFYGTVMESSLEHYFDFIDNSDWSEVTAIFTPFSKTQSRLEKVLIDNKFFLTLYATLLKKVNVNGQCFKLMVTDLLHLLTNVKLSTTSEPKVVLLIVFSLKLIEMEMKVNRKEGISLLARFFTILNDYVETNESGFLSVVGLTKSSLSNRFRLICLGICSGIVIFLKKNYHNQTAKVDDKILQVLESIERNKSYQNISQYASYVKTTIADVETIEEIISFAQDVGFKFFNTSYLK